MEKTLKIHGLDISVRDCKVGEAAFKAPPAGVHPDVEAAHKAEMVKMGIDEDLQSDEIAFTASPPVCEGTEVIDGTKRFVVTSCVGERSRAKESKR